MTARLRSGVFALSLLAVLTAILAIPAHTASRQAPHATPAIAPAPAHRQMSPPMAQNIYAPLGSPASWADVDVILNNNSPTQMEVTPTLFANGQAIPGVVITLAPAEVRWVSLASLLGRAGRHLRMIDGLDLSYSGHWLELGAQVLLRSPHGRGSADVFFTDTSAYASRRLDAVWWAPAHAQSVLVLANASDEAISVSMDGTDAPKKPVVLQPHASHTLVLHDHEHRGKRPDGGAADWIAMRVDGPLASLRAAGFVEEAGGRLTGPIRFYDPATPAQANLFATNLLVHDADPHLVLMNTSDDAVVATPRFLPSQGENGAPIELAPVRVEPHDAVRLDLAPLRHVADLQPDLVEVSAQVLNSGNPGSLIGALSALDLHTGLTHEVPLRDTGLVNGSTGSYPWRLDADFSTTVSITNVGELPTRFLARVTYPGGVYWITAHDLDAGASATFDLGHIRDQRVPDRDGHVLPRTEDQGQFRWSIIDAEPGQHLIGRVSLVSRSAGISGSYSCQVCCPDGYDYGELQPGAIPVPGGGVSDFGVTEDLADCYGNPAGQVDRYASSWNVQYPSITAVQTTGTGSAQASGLSGGTSTVQGHWSTSYYESDEFDHICNQFSTTADAPGDVTTSQPASLRVTYDQYLWQNPGDYNRERHYQVLDQNGQPMLVSGMAVTENYSSPAGNCGVAVQTGHATTNSNGEFKDNYSLTGAPPNPCQSTATQHHLVNGTQVSTFNVTWTYTAVSVQ